MKKKTQKVLPSYNPLWQFKKWLAVTAAAATMLPGAMAVPAAESTQSETLDPLTVHFIDVGQGLAILAQAGDDVLVYDGGNSDAASYFVSYLQQEGVTDIDYMIASHYDADHLNGLVGALHAFDTDTIIAPDYEHNSKLYTSFYNTVSEQGKEVTYPEVGDEYEFGEGSFTILGPTEIRDDSNNNSVVVRLDYGDTSFLFTGDAEAKEEKDIIAANEDLDCDVLSVGHHGSASSTSWDFLEQVLPEYAVISCGVNNSYGHPDPDTIEKLDSVEAQIFRTDLQGNIIAISDGETISWNTEPSNGEVVNEIETQVWLSATGSKYHSRNNCGNMNPDTARQVTESDAISQGYEKCKKCW